MSVSGLVNLGRGAVIPLDRRVGEPVDVVVNGRVIARGEVVVMDEGTSRFGISLTEVGAGSGSAWESRQIRPDGEGLGERPTRAGTADRRRQGHASPAPFQS